MVKIITSHERADMDALASIYAASLLFPEHLPVLPYKLNRNLREFLSLYRDEMPFVPRREIARGAIEEVVLVDTLGIAPIRGMDKNTRIRIIDHHIPTRPLPESSVFEGEPVGATTTLLTERIQRQRIAIHALGASLLLMGIYEDTGALSHGTTTARDALAAAWLLEQGADLELVNRFLHRPLSNGQREVLTQLVNRSTIHTIRGRSICVSMVVLEHYVDELSSLIHQIIDVYEPDACFLLAQHEHSIQIIARSATDAIDVAKVLRAFGGGGHSRAAAALADGTTLENVSDRLLRLLEQQIVPPMLVREIMSTNVHTLGLDMSVRDAAQMMRRYGHEGFPVVEGDRLIGILTRSDVDRALHHQLDSMPVRSILHTGPLHVRPDDPIDEVQRVMIEHGLGQVPVVKGDRFAGIVTRTDLIHLYAPSRQPSRAEEIRRVLEEALPQGLSDLLLISRDVANDLGCSLYIVGGFVRDLLLGAPTLDLDLVVEGDAIRMAHQLAPQIGGRVRSHARFGTAKIILEGERAEGVPPSLDFVTARTEFYERPSVLPTVESSSIRQDLYRRDFTINTMAICLDRSRYGELLDYYGGERDLGEKRIRVLHNLSFVEDPTRILRAVRFEQRLDFDLETRSGELLKDAIDLLDNVTGERLRHELYLILDEREPERSLDRLARLGVLEKLHPNMRFSRVKAQHFQRLRQRFHTMADASPSALKDVGAPLSLGVCYLALLTSDMNARGLESFVDRIRIRGDDARFLYEVSHLCGGMEDLLASVMLPSTIYHLLHPFSRDARFVLSVLTDSELLRERLDLYERQISTTRARIDGHYLRGLGVPPGPIYGEILGRVRDALLDEQIGSLEEERRLASQLVAAIHGPRERREGDRGVGR